MMVIIKSPPLSKEAGDAVMRAADMTADIILIKEAVGLALKDALKGFCGTAFALAEDVARGLPEGAELDKGVKLISASEMEKMMLEGEEASGPF